MSIEAKAAVQLQEVPLSELERIATVFGYSFAAPPRHLAGGYASCNFAVSLVPLDGSSATPLTGRDYADLLAEKDREIKHLKSVLKDATHRQVFLSFRKQIKKFKK